MGERERTDGDISIVPYADSNWSQVCAIHDRARPIELQGSCDKKAFIPLAQDKSAYDDFNTSIKYVAYFGNVLAGFVGTQKDKITWLYVEPDLFGAGIGRALLQKSLSQLSGAAYLYVLSNNAAALHLYESEGFSPVREFSSKENGYECVVLHMSQ